jgi:bifunctional oligoribonuclease and PAP phosphatase NrnA
MINIQSQIVEKLKSSKNIVITAHISPDGDSIGSSLALYHFCKALNLSVTVCHPDSAPMFLSWLDGFNQILNYDKHTDKIDILLAEADLIFCLDYNEVGRVGEKMKPAMENSTAFKIMIDHHLNPSNFADIVYSDTTSCSTCQLVYELIEKSSCLNLLDKTIGTAIYLGVMTDTGSFRFNSVKPYTHELIANLLRIGVENDVIHERVFDVNTVDKLKLRGYATSEKLTIIPEFKLAYIALSREELNKFAYQKGDTEGLVNVALSIEGVLLAAFFSEDDDKIKISFRSKGKLHPVNLLSQKYFSGGGHANAAGGKYVGSLKDAIDLFVRVIPEYI